MKISVVTVCFNAEKTIERTIQSVLNQDYGDIEYVVVDGASKDRTLEILSKYKDRIRVISEKDKGIYDAMNKGWKAATGDLVHFLNADDWYMDSKSLSRFVAAIGNHSREEGLKISEHLWHGKLNYHHNDGKITTMGFPATAADLRFDLRGIHQPATLFPRGGIDKAGGFDITYRISADYDLIRRHVAIYKPIYVNETLTCMADGGASANQHHKGIAENISIAIAHGENPLRTRVHGQYIATFMWLRYRVPVVYHALKTLKDTLQATKNG